MLLELVWIFFSATLKAFTAVEFRLSTWVYVGNRCQWRRNGSERSRLRNAKSSPFSGALNCWSRSETVLVHIALAVDLSPDLSGGFPPSLRAAATVHRPSEADVLDVEGSSTVDRSAVRKDVMLSHRFAPAGHLAMAFT